MLVQNRDFIFILNLIFITEIICYLVRIIRVREGYSHSNEKRQRFPINAANPFVSSETRKYDGPVC